MRGKFVLMIFAFLVCAMASFCKQEKSGWIGDVKDEGGVVVVKNPKEPLFSNEVVTLEEELSIGEEGGGDYLFSQIRYLEVDEDENIYVADTKEMQVKVFDKEGQFIRAIGNAGQGPGEIGRIYGMQIINPEGEVIKKIIRDYDPVLISEEEKESRKSEILKIQPDRKIDMSRHHPPFRYFVADDEDRIYVETREKPENGEGNVYDIFDEEGKYIAKVVFSFRPQVWKKGKVYAIKEDEEGFQMVKRYKVTWNY